MTRPTAMFQMSIQPLLSPSQQWTRYPRTLLGHSAGTFFFGSGDAALRPEVLLASQRLRGTISTCAPGARNTMAKARISTGTGPVTGCNMARTQHAAPIKRKPPPRSRRRSRRHFLTRQGTGLSAHDTPTTVTTTSSPRSDCPPGLLERKTKEGQWRKCKMII